MLRNARLQSRRHTCRASGVLESSHAPTPLWSVACQPQYPGGRRSNSSGRAGRQGLSFGPLRKAPPPTPAPAPAPAPTPAPRSAPPPASTPAPAQTQVSTSQSPSPSPTSTPSNSQPQLASPRPSASGRATRSGISFGPLRAQSQQQERHAPPTPEPQPSLSSPSSPSLQSTSSADRRSSITFGSLRSQSQQQQQTNVGGNGSSLDRRNERSGISFDSLRPQTQQQPDRGVTPGGGRDGRSGISFGSVRSRFQQQQAGDNHQNTASRPFGFQPRNNNNNNRREERSGPSSGAPQSPGRRTQTERWESGTSESTPRNNRVFEGGDARDRSSGRDPGRWKADRIDRPAASWRVTSAYGVKDRPAEDRPWGTRRTERWTTQEEQMPQRRSTEPPPPQERRHTPPSAKNWRVPDERPSKKDAHRQDDEYDVKPKASARRKETEVDRKLQEIAQGPKEVFLPEMISVNNLSRLVGVKPRSLQTTMMQLGMTDTRPGALLKFDDSAMLCAEYNLNAVSNEEAAFDIYPSVPPTAEEKATLPFRPPVVTVMGHVDHGKTSLLDRLRSASVAAGEAGGITQHIGAFSVPVKGASGSDANSVSKITFLDTPGHAAFSNMRARGAKATDIVVLVVAADDGVMAQTKEVIQLYHALEAEARASAEAEADEGSDKNKNGATPLRKKNNIQLLVALSKCDRPAAEPRRAKEQLAAESIFVEDMGGEVPCVEISSKTGQGFDSLEETLAVMAELGDLRSPVTGLPEGIVLESRTEKGLGNTATVLVTRGTLTPGNFLIAGHCWGKVRGMVDSNGKSVKSAKAGEAVLVSGWKELPVAGEEVLSAAKEDAVKKAVENRKEAETRRQMVREAEAINETRRKRREEEDRLAQEDFLERERRRQIRMAEEQGGASAAAVMSEAAGTDAQKGEADDGVEVREVRLIVKSDFSGTGEALEGSVSGLVLNCPGHSARVKILSLGVGDLSESDLSMARAGSDGHHTALVGFNVKAPRSILQQAKTHSIDVFSSAIIYEIIDYVKSSLSSVLPRQIETRVAGEATIAQTFSIAAGKGQSLKVAGVRVTNGVVSRANLVRVLRPVKGRGGGDEEKMEMIFEGRLSSIKQVKKEVQEMRKGTECGLSFDGFEAFAEGDVVHCVEQTEVAVPFN